MSAKLKIFITLLLSILLTGVVGTLRLTPLSSEVKSNYFWLNKFENTTKVDIVVYGDSRTYRGFSPEVLTAGTGLKGYNYGFTSAGYSNDIFELIDSRIDRTTDPVILLGITPYSLTLAASENKFYKQEMGRDSLEKFKRLNIDLKLSFFDRVILEEYFKVEEKCLFQGYGADGWVSSNRILIDTLAGLKSYQSIFEDNQVSDSIINSVICNVSRWVESGIRVYAYRPPTVVSMEILENDKSGFNSALFISEFEKSGGRWITVPNDGRYISYDGSHLQKESAIDLSRFIRKFIFD